MKQSVSLLAYKACLKICTKIIQSIGIAKKEKKQSLLAFVISASGIE